MQTYVSRSSVYFSWSKLSGIQVFLSSNGLGNFCGKIVGSKFFGARKGLIVLEFLWIVAPEISVDRCRRTFCGSLSQKFLWNVVPEMSVEHSLRNFFGSLPQKFLWIVVAEISVEGCRRNFCGSLPQKFLWFVVPEISVDSWLREIFCRGVVVSEISACESLSKKFL